MKFVNFGMSWVSMVMLVMVMLSIAVISSTPLQCDDPEENPEATYGKLQSIPPPSGSDSIALADQPVQFVPPKTQQDVLKSRNSKFLGVDRSSEES
ncbi:uncharacterized protein LOC126568630 [Anopheles maculipalpis]|uniref:uncharacterized protein LOC126568630 n=1 Tax=Anopheles maculipalpis TaxID=1496333 RepID=UPI0021594EAD|nr:uncharacterized protein LOC126568630 [Anopheles maculipalpis]